LNGRTEGPGSISDSSRPGYQQHLRDYQEGGRFAGGTYYIEPNNDKDAYRVFEKIRARGQFPEVTAFEPVMGEGNPGVPVERGFYDCIRELSKNAGGLLLADSVQAGWRVTGELSVTRYEWMQGIDPPDMETFSKAINGGQYPLSILAMSKEIGDKYVRGLYGNTMTSNPRALDVASAVLDGMTPEVRQNIRDSGLIFKNKLIKLAEKHSCLVDVTGTGLLIALHVKPSIDVMQIEKEIRLRGLNVIHGGENALRFTPWFHLSEAEIDLMIGMMDELFTENYAGDGENERFG
jgi:4-aminobutyrate aminotransferase-like enzyme